jgi:hypothetical protein
VFSFLLRNPQRKCQEEEETEGIDLKNPGRRWRQNTWEGSEPIRKTERTLSKMEPWRPEVVSI